MFGDISETLNLFNYTIPSIIRGERQSELLHLFFFADISPSPQGASPSSWHRANCTVAAASCAFCDRKFPF